MSLYVHRPKYVLGCHSPKKKKAGYGTRPLPLAPIEPISGAHAMLANLLALGNTDFLQKWSMYIFVGDWSCIVTGRPIDSQMLSTGLRDLTDELPASGSPGWTLTRHHVCELIRWRHETTPGLDSRILQWKSRKGKRRAERGRGKTTRPSINSAFE